MPLKIYNTATRALEEFTPSSSREVTMYNCGPTVYNFPHIGNLRAYVFADILRRTLEMNGYTVKQVINITDVGHLVSDADEGEDKMAVGAKREGKSVEQIIKLYSDAFYDDLTALNIKAGADRGKEECFPRATHHIPEQKALIEELAKKGFTYETKDGIYFDTAKFPRYADFAHLDVKGLEAGSRVSLGDKRNPTDFALWKFSPEDGAQREQEWDSPLGIARKGFPGWHVECSAMSMKYLGETIDIHTGGIDHIPVHHTNEIAQSECATGKQFVRYWMHSAFMTVDGQKMSKSLGNTYTLSDLDAQDISREAFRYWLLTASYRTTVNFTFNAVLGSKAAFRRLQNLIYVNKEAFWESKAEVDNKYFEEFMDAMNNDLNTAQAISVLWKLAEDQSVPNDVRIKTAEKMDELLGLNLVDTKEILNTVYAFAHSPELQTLLDARKTAREEKNWAESDRLRDEINKLGYEVKDTPDGQKISQI